MKSSPLILVEESPCASLSDQPNNFGTEAMRMKVRIGRSVPRIRLNTVIKGEYTIMDPTAIADRWLALCFVSVLLPADVSCLNSQAASFAREGAVLLAVLPDEILLDPAQHRVFQILRVPLVTDPLNRLHRAYGIPRHPVSLKAKTFLIDPERLLRHHVVHDLTMWSMDSLRGLMHLKREDTNLNNA